MLLLSGCATNDVDPPRPSASPPAPLFESEEDAVAAAEAALTEYWATADEVFQGGGADVHRLEPLVADEFFADVTATADIYAEEGWTQTGTMKFDSTAFQQTYASSDTNFLLVTTCLDYMDFSITSAGGHPIELVDDSLRRAHEFTFEVDRGGDRYLLVAGIEPWPGLEC